MCLRLALALAFCFTLSGCALAPSGTPSAEKGLALEGAVHGGQQPVNGAHVYLLAASTAGYGTASTSLITSGAAGTDSIGSYVLSDATGHFSITGDYTCTLGQQVYLYALGGNPGAGANSLSGLMAAVGSCPAAGNFLVSVPFIAMNELSTIAFAYAASDFATDPLHIGSSSSALAATGMANAFASVSNLVTTSTGVALATTPAGNGSVPSAELATLANILAACLNTNGTLTGPTSPTPCYTLAHNATNGSTLPTDTAAAAINIAHNPTVAISTLFGLQTASAPFSPSLTSAPNDFTVNITFTGGGLATSTAQIGETSYTVNNLAVDAAGNIWKPNYDANTLTELNPVGAPLSGNGGFTGGGLNNPANVAVDLGGNVWVGNFGGSSVSKFSSAGSALSGSPFTAGGISTPHNLAVDGTGNVWIVNPSTLSKLTGAGSAASGSPFSTNSLNITVGIAVLPSGNVWITNAGSNNVAVYASAGTAASGSPYSGGGQNFPYGVAFDASGNGWLADDSAMTRLSSSGAPGSSPFSAPSGAVLVSDAVDGLGNIWVTDTGNNTILELNSSAAYISGAIGFQRGQSAIPEAVAIDGSGNIWYSTYNDATIHELVGAAAPVTTPLSYGVRNSLLGTRP